MSRAHLPLPLPWQAWTRLLWGVAALASLATFIGTVVLTRRFVDDLPERIGVGLAALGWSHEVYFWFTAATIAPLFLVFFVVGAAIFWLRPHDRMAFFTSIFLMSFGAANSFSPTREYLLAVATAPLAFAIPTFIAGMLSFGLLATFFALFPDGRFVPGWMRWIAAESFLFSLAWNLFPGVVGDFTGPLGSVSLIGAFVMLVGSMAGQVWRYRNYATPVQKQQTKMLVFGLVLIVAILVIPSFLVYSANVADPRTSLLFDLSVSVTNLSFALLPIAIAVSILRYRLWDIDVIIRKTLQYALLTGILALVYFGSVTLLQSAVSAVSGQQSAIATVLSTLAIAALFSPLRGRVQAWIDRRFYRRKYDAQQVLAAFALTARDETDLDSLTRELQRVAVETMQPESAGVWLFGATAGRGEHV